MLCGWLIDEMGMWMLHSLIECWVAMRNERWVMDVNEKEST